MMEVLSHPFGAARPVFLLPDRRSGFDLVDQVSPSFERVTSVRRGDRYRDRDLADSQFTDTVDCSHFPDRPAIPDFGHHFGDLVDDLLVVGLVFEMGHIGSPGRVITYGSDEQHNGTGLRHRDRGDDRRRIDRIRRYGDQI